MLVATMKENDPERDTQRKQFKEAVRFHEWACEALPLHYSYASFLMSGLRVESNRRTIRTIRMHLSDRHCFAGTQLKSFG